MTPILFVFGVPRFYFRGIKNEIMARKTSTELFELVKAMTPSEKRYFKIFASLHTVGEQNKYMKLFDLMDDMVDYKEELLIKGVNDKGGVTFSKLKKYLYDLILKAMRNFNIDKNGTHQLTAAVDDISILFNKGLYKQAQKAVGKAEKIIKEYELISYNFLIDNWKRRTQLHLNANTKLLPEDMSLKIGEYQLLNEYMEAFGAAQEFTRKWSAITHINQLPVKMQDKIKAQLPTSAPAKIKFFHLRIQSVYNRLTRDYDAYLQNTLTALELVESHPAFQNEDVLIYTLEPLLEYCNALLNAGKMADFQKHIKKTTPYIVASKLTISAEGRANIDACINLMKSEFDRRNGRKMKYQDHVATIQSIKKDPQLHPSEALKNLYYWETIQWHFMMNDHEKAITTIDEMKKDIPEYQTMQAANAVKWLCFYSLKWTEDLKIAISEDFADSGLETELANCLKEQLEDETLGKWMNLKKSLTRLLNIPQEKLHFKYFDFITWINDIMLNDDSLTSVKRQLHYYHT